MVGTESIGRRLGFGIFKFSLAELPRILLPLPFVSQACIEPNPAWLVALGLVILLVSLFLAPRSFASSPSLDLIARNPCEPTALRLCRHPLMLCDIFWPLGWSLIFGSMIGIALTPLWLLIIWALPHVEEESLVRQYGDAYRHYQSSVPRLLPRLQRSRGKYTAGR